MAEDERQIPSRYSGSLLSRMPDGDRLAEMVHAVIELAGQVEALHRQGRLHLRIGIETVSRTDDGKLHLSPPAEEVIFGGPCCEPEFCPPSLQTARVVVVPTDLQQAKKALTQAGHSLEPESIDLHQLAALLCRVLTGEPLSASLRNPKTNDTIPSRLRNVIERAIGQPSGSPPLGIAEFARHLRQFTACEAEPGASSFTEDTAPSIHAPKDKSDTSISQERKSMPPPELLPFQRLGHFEIRERIGQGGMGDVYKAYERSLDRTVAVKVLPLEFSRSEEFVRRFYAEASAIARLVHPNVIQIFSMGEDRGYHYFAMQYVEGVTLADRLADQKTLGLEETLIIVKQLLQGLSAAHEFGLVHRDIKPGNILLEAKTKTAYLADFGLVKSLQQSEGFTATGMVMGTVDYISPEQGRGQPVDVRADLYSLGVVIYRMLSGRLPFEAKSPTAMIFQHVYETPCPLSQVLPALPIAYSRIVEKLLAKNPNDRYPSAADLLNDLNAAQGNQPLSLKGSLQSLHPHGAGLTQAPSYPVETALPSDLEELVEANRWKRFWNRAVDFFFEPSPEYCRNLQNAHLQVVGAVAAYEHRRRNLQQLSQQAESVLATLHEQLDEWIAAAENAEGRIDGTSDPKVVREARAEYDRCQNNIVAFYDQIAQRSAERDEILAEHHQVEAQLHRIQHQRDLLMDRLKVTQAQLHLADARTGIVAPSGDRLAWAKRYAPTILVVLLVGLFFYRILLWERP